MACPVDAGGATPGTAAGREAPAAGGGGGTSAGQPDGGGPADGARPRLWPLYAGGFLGPFGGAMIASMLPELAEGLGTTRSAAAWGLTVYMLPFAGLMVFSGTLAERWGRRRTLLGAYLVYACASLLCAVAPTTSVFLGGRALQGVANAFTTPVLIASISDMVAPTRLGASIGRYGALQAAGMAFAPLIGGLAATVQWRLAFVGSVVAALALATVLPPDTKPAHGTEVRDQSEGRVRAMLNRKLALASVVAFLAQTTSSASTVLVALLATDRFGLAPGPRGLVVAGFGVAGLVFGGRLGRLSDQVGVRRFGLFATLGLGLSVAAAGLSPTLLGVVVAVAVAGAAATGCRIVVSALAVTSTPRNRGGATSMALAWLFFGSAIAPVVWLPVYDVDPTTGLVAAASGALAAAAVLATVGGRGRGPRTALRRAGALSAGT